MKAKYGKRGSKPTWETYEVALNASEYVEERKIRVLGVSGEWKGRQTKIKQECLQCGLIWEKGNIGNAMNGSGCPSCRIGKLTGRRKVQDSTHCELYLMYTKGVLKFGITSSVEHRLYDNRQDGCVLLYFTHADSQTLRNVESMLKVKLPCGAASKEEFGAGWTETITGSEIPRMAELLSYEQGLIMHIVEDDIVADIFKQYGF